jgi:exopolysaccharide biosynthesis polyprenyl glycosylphosphotransferase
MVAAPHERATPVASPITHNALTGTPVIKIATLLFLLPILLSIARRLPYRERTLIIGTGPLARLLISEIAERPGGYTWLAGVVDDAGRIVERPLDELLVGPLARLATIVEEMRPDRIVIALADRRGRLPVHELLQARVQGIAIEDGVQFYERLTGKIAIEALAPHDLISSPDFRKSHVDLAFGHALSLVVSLVALVVLLPLFALIALAIKLDSPGPVFFVQNRVGLRGRPLKLLKFRTMHPAVARSASEWVCDNCDRITRVGQWLRRYRLDELPQLVNVLQGEMNLVGPRPHPVSNLELFNENIPYYWLRSLVRPGLTGWAQVRQGYANGLEEETEKMRHDLYYIKHMSAWLDLRILFSTVQTVLSGHGSPGVADRVSMPAVRSLRLTPAAHRTTSA